jgi:molybdate transport system substrate-binding protein
VRRAWALGALLVAGLAAAGTLALAAAPASTADRPVVLAAASLSEVLPRLEPEGRYSFAGSNQLAQQIRLGAPFDVFLSASPRYTGELSRERLVRTPVTFATSSLVLIVPRANPQRIRGVRDLARRPKLRLVVAGPTVPIGLYTREVLKRLGLLGVLRRAVSLEPDVKGVVGKVALGEADAGFVYATDARTAGRRVEAVALPASAQPTVRYEAAIAASPQSLGAAQAFLRALRGPEGRRALRAAGFGTP